MSVYTNGVSVSLINAEVNTFDSQAIASIATNGSSYFPIMNSRYAGSVVGATFLNSTTASMASGTTTGSSASIVLYKNASSAASVIATFNGSGTAVATLGTAALLFSGTAGTTNATLAAGDTVIGEVRGGAANNASQAGAFLQVDIQYSR